MNGDLSFDIMKGEIFALPGPSDVSAVLSGHFTLSFTYDILVLLGLPPRR